jgi:pimeloyl-ACP methyl ester carboxylesterase
MSSSSFSSYSDDIKANTEAGAPVPHPEEPNLYEIPSDLHPAYRALPGPAAIAVALFSAATAALTTFSNPKIIQWRLFAALYRHNWKIILSFLAKTILLCTFTTLLVQDLFLPPSRVSMETLLHKYFLPSRLSRYEHFKIEDRTTGIHFLEYANTEQPAKWDCLYVNHGFGASSLSWLPAIPGLAEKAKARVVLGHDAAGFGFTDRPSSKDDFTLKATAKLGMSVLQSRAPKTVLLLGHSMGSITTMRMALDLPPDTVARVILVAPSLGLSRVPKPGQENGMNGNPRRRLHRPASAAAYLTRLKEINNALLAFPVAILQAFLSYALRRLVGNPGFWRKGLQLAWGNPLRVKNSDVLRFQWPSIGKDWEKGFISFSSAQLLPGDKSDGELLQAILDRGVKVDVVVGSKDKVVPENRIRGFLEDFPSVRIVAMEDMGHDPFEEDVPAFLDVVSNLLAES